MVFSSEDQGLAALPPGGFDRRWSAREVERVENRLDDRTLLDQGDHLTSSTAEIAAKHILLEAPGEAPLEKVFGADLDWLQEKWEAYILAGD